MSSLRTEVRHQLGKTEAQQRLKDFLARVIERYKDQVTHFEGAWDDSTLRFLFTTYGFDISGLLTVEEDVARLEAKLPLAALAFKGKLEKVVSTELQRELS